MKHEYDAEKSVLYEKEVELIQFREGKAGYEQELEKLRRQGEEARAEVTRQAGEIDRLTRVVNTREQEKQQVAK